MEEILENKNEENAVAGQQETEAVSETEEVQAVQAGPNGWLESIYEHFSIVPLKVLDCFIVVCVIALISVVTVGVLRAKGIL